MKKSFKWAFKTLILSISLSIVFSMVSQSLFPKLSATLSLFVIAFFIVLSVIFDMVNVAVTTINVKQLKNENGKRGYETALKLCQNREKVSSFCGDVVGDICGILSGAGGVSLVVNMHIPDMNVYFVVTCLISSLIAGLTIFGKAIMKNFAVEKCAVVVMKTGFVLEGSFFSLFRFSGKKTGKRNKKGDFGCGLSKTPFEERKLPEKEKNLKNMKK
ncbi:MAG: hypothetical protein J6K39_02730 [Clostridia bacterium]|nr:hypothetical protein [Clostridia bacterium]